MSFIVGFFKSLITDYLRKFFDALIHGDINIPPGLKWFGVIFILCSLFSFVVCIGFGYFFLKTQGWFLSFSKAYIFKNFGKIDSIGDILGLKINIITVIQHAYTLHALIWIAGLMTLLLMFSLYRRRRIRLRIMTHNQQIEKKNHLLLIEQRKFHTVANVFNGILVILDKNLRIVYTNNKYVRYNIYLDLDLPEPAVGYGFFSIFWCLREQFYKQICTGFDTEDYVSNRKSKKAEVMIGTHIRQIEVMTQPVGNGEPMWLCVFIFDKDFMETFNNANQIV